MAQAIGKSVLLERVKRYEMASNHILSQWLEKRVVSVGQKR